ncbi:MAG: oligosaccharide flippase family protein [Clostridium paraputrificum]|nr:oligosaccharide flippase family protein [Clostridium paraputrificum]MDY4721985.1 oligosaccharide flippase family protein [Clostridium paraputrificum]
MSRVKLFIENFLVYGLGSMISKIVPLVMLPIITRILPNEEIYGINDIASLAISFGSVFIMMGIYDGLFRIFFDKDETTYKKSIVSSSLFFVLITSLVVLILIVPFTKEISNMLFASEEYRVLVVIIAFSMCLNTISVIVGAPTRMQNKRKIYLFINTLSPIISYSISIPMIIFGNATYALPLATLSTSIFIIVFFLYINRTWFDLSLVSKKYIKEMLLLGMPLVPNVLIYWIFNSCDRLFIGQILGNGQVGVYGVGARIASVSQLIYTAFASGWQYFAYSTMKEKDQIDINSKLFEMLSLISFISTCLLIMFSKFIFNILFTGDYIEGYKVVPYLFLSPLILMLIQILSSQLMIIKKTIPSTVMLTIGAVVNLVFNSFLIKSEGIEGAAIATLIGYIFSLVLFIYYLTKQKQINISNKFKINMVLMLLFLFIWKEIIRSNDLIVIIFGGAIIFLMLIQYKEDLNQIFNKLKFLLNSKLKNC